SITHPSNDYQSSVHHNAYSPPSSIPQIAYASTVNQQQQPEFPSIDSGVTVMVFKQGDDPIDAINHMMSFLSAVVTSRYHTTNNQLRNSSNPCNKLPLMMAELRYNHFRGDNFFLLWVQVDPTLQEQVEATQGNKGLLFVTTAKEKDTCLKSALNLKGNGMIRGLRIKCCRIMETIHVDFDELTAMASEHSSSRPALHEMTPATISSGLVPNTPPSTPFVPPSRTYWDILFQPLFDELLTPPPSVDHPAPEVIAPIAEVLAPKPTASTGSPFTTTIDQDEPSHSNSQTTPKTQSPIMPNIIEEYNHDLDVAHMNNDLFFPMQEELNEFERLEVWEVVPRLDKVMVVTLKWIYKVKLDELGGEYSQWVERFMNYLDEQDRKAAVLYEYEMFKSTEGELLLDTYIRYLQVINDLKKCGYSKDNCELNFKFLNNLQPEWKQSKEKVIVSPDSEGSEADDFSELKKITALLAKASFL
nr:integrase, catalytic region, zinc finger, CCHC-type, peptidase aspartic, catalytic [Tanacetum cinerariifolium]